ncbi:lipopolysaccharide heptosyltransferase II [Pseudohongiella spirulinae]|uniref:lipopolysaccharide heptosyltransferase II n=1 Tax=Pseudohongiella spirulinae TaxID=1249552 RepID=UPI00214F03F4|nr:lipopolysaccharide heptosyltransferase II [Pseudohongiella spirulinae]
MTQVQRILIVGPSWIGDMVMAQSLFMVLKQQQPQARIDVLAPAWSMPLLSRMPQLENAIELPFDHGQLRLQERRQFGRNLSANRYDQVIVLPNSFKSAIVPWFADIPQRTGWRGEMRGWILNDSRRLDKTALPLMVQRFVALALPATSRLPEELPDPIPVPQLTVSPADSQHALELFGLKDETPILMLCPAAEFGDAKRWPTGHYATVAKNRIEAGWQVVLLGSAKDQAITGKIASQVNAPHCFDLAGRTTLAQAIDLLSVAGAVVSNDSGLMHVAAALHRPLVALYGSTSPKFTPPLSDRVVMLYTDIKCRPCFKRECPLQHKKCLTELAPRRVLDALAELQNPVLAGESALCVS